MYRRGPVLYSRVMKPLASGASMALVAPIVMLGGAACGDDNESGPTSPSSATTTQRPSSPTPTDEPFSGGTEPVEATASASPPLGGALLVNVRVGEHSSFDRITFEFEEGLPGYTVQYVDVPIVADPSGMEVALGGSAFIEVRMEPAAAHDPNTGDATYTGATELKPNLVSLVEAERTGDFEAVLTWVLGVTEKTDFRVLTLQDPPRLVVDIGRP